MTKFQGYHTVVMNKQGVLLAHIDHRLMASREPDDSVMRLEPCCPLAAVGAAHMYLCADNRRDILDGYMEGKIDFHVVNVATGAVEVWDFDYEMRMLDLERLAG